MPKNWLPESDARQNQIPLLFEFPFGILNVRKGQKALLPEEEFQAARQARVRLPKLPAARTWLELAMRWAKRLQADPRLTRVALAKEVGISPTRLTHILNLLNLAPSIMQAIFALEPSIKRNPISESRLRHIARLKDLDLQVREFARLREIHRSFRPAT